MLQDLRSLYQENLFESVIPFWMRHSIDREYGGYFTALDRDGALYDTRKYIWLNGRQVWTLSRLYNEVERRPEWLEAARLGAEFLRKYAFDEQGRCYFSLTREGVPSFYQRKPYAGVFVMLGLYEYWKASGEAWYRDKALELFELVPKWIADPTTLGRPALGGGIATSNLADIYVMCAMALEIGRDDVLAECLKQIPTHYDPEHRIFYETAALAPELRRSSPDVRLICVGSNFEISWFLFRALDRVADARVEKMLLEILEGAMEFGWDREKGGLYYFQDIENKPMLQLEGQMKLWWVHVEALYALLVAYARTKDEKWLRYHEKVQEYVWSRFPDPEHGEWYGYLTREGVPSHSLKGNHYKGCFHIPRALLFSIQLLEKAPF